MIKVWKLYDSCVLNCFSISSATLKGHLLVERLVLVRFFLLIFYVLLVTAICESVPH